MLTTPPADRRTAPAIRRASRQEEAGLLSTVKEGVDEPAADVRFPGEEGGVHKDPDEPGPFLMDQVVVENPRKHNEYVPFVEDHPGFIDLERQISFQHVEAFCLFVIMAEGAAAGSMGCRLFGGIEIPGRTTGKGRDPGQGNGAALHGKDSFIKTI